MKLWPHTLFNKYNEWIYYFVFYMANRINFFYFIYKKFTYTFMNEKKKTGSIQSM